MKRKKVDRRKLIYTFVFFIFCIFGLTVAYAALSTTLNISGNAEVSSSEWGLKVEKISFSDLPSDELCSIYTCDDYMAYTSGVKIISEPIIDGTTLRDYEISVTKPGDMSVFSYKVTNIGSIPVVYESFTNKIPSITSSIGSSSDVEWARNNISFPYEGSSYINGEFGDRDIVLGDVICPGDSVVLFMGVMVDDVDSIPSASVTLSNLGFDMNFVQGESNLCS